MKLKPLASIISPQVPLEGEKTLPADEVSKFHCNKFLVAGHLDAALLMLRPRLKQKIVLSKYREQKQQRIHFELTHDTDIRARRLAGKHKAM